IPLLVNYGTRVRDDARGASETIRPGSAKVYADRIPRLGVVNEPDLAAIGPEATAEGGVSDRSKLSVWWRVYGQVCGRFNDTCPVPQRSGSLLDKICELPAVRTVANP